MENSSTSSSFSSSSEKKELTHSIELPELNELDQSAFEIFKRKFQTQKESWRMEALELLISQDFKEEEVLKAIQMILATAPGINFWSAQFRVKLHLVVSLVLKGPFGALSLNLLTYCTSLLEQHLSYDSATLLELFNWSNELLSLNQEQDLIKDNNPVPVLLKLAQVQFKCILFKIFSQPMQIYHPIFLLELLKLPPHEHLVGALDVLTSFPSAQDPLHRVLSFLSFCLTVLQDRLIEWYSTISLGGKLTSSHQCDYFCSILSSLNLNEFSQKLLPSITSAVKRNAESILIPLAHLFEKLSVVLDTEVDSLFSLIVPLVHSSKLETRKQARIVLGHIISHIVDPTLLTKLFKLILGNLKGKGPHERSDIVGVSQDLFDSSKLEQRQKLASLVIEDLGKMMTTETNESVLYVAFGSLASWFSVLPTWSAEIEKTMLALLKREKERNLNILLLCFIRTLQNSSKPNPTIVKLAPQILTVLQNAKQGFENINSTHLLLILGLSDKNILEQVKKTTALKSESPLLKLSFLKKLDVFELTQWFDLFYFVLDKYSNTLYLEMQPTERTLMFNSLLFVLTHPDRKLRTFASSKLSALGRIDVAKPLLESLYFNTIETQSSWIGNPLAIQNVLSAAACPDPSLFPMGFVLAHHPGLQRPCQFTSWKNLMKKAGIKKLEEQTQTIIKEIASNRFLFHSNATLQQCCFLTIDTLKNHPVVLEHLAFELQNHVWMVEKQLSNLPESKLKLYQTPSSQVFDQNYLEELVKKFLETKSGAKSKQQGKKYSGMSAKEDEEWERNLRKELEEKHRKEFEKEIEEIRQKVLSEEALVRQGINWQVQQIELTIKFFNEMRRMTPKLAHDLMFVTVPLFVQLINNKWSFHQVNSLALVSLGLLHQIVGSQLAALSLELSGLLNLIYTHREPFHIEFALTAFLTELEQRIDSSHLLPGGSFTYLFLVLRYVLMSESFNFSLREKSLHMLTLHCAAETTGFPHREMLELLIYTLASPNTDFQTRSKQALVALCSRLQFPPSQQDSMLGGLFGGLISSVKVVRISALEGLMALPFPLIETPMTSARLWFAYNDDQQQNFGVEMWTKYGHTLQQNQFWDTLSPLLSSSDSTAQNIGAKAIANAIKEFPETQQTILGLLEKLYEDHLPTGPRDPLLASKLVTRHGVAECLGNFKLLGELTMMEQIFTLLLKKFLYDPDESIREHLTQSGLNLVNEVPKKTEQLFKTFEELCTKPSQSDEEDHVRESAIVFMGAAGRHMESNNPKLNFILEKLLDSLKIPSQQVQKSVANCLVPLMPKFSDKADELIKGLLEQIRKGKDYAERRGAAFGLAGVVKGLGSGALKKYEIMAELEKCSDDKKHNFAREGAMMAYECLSMFLGRVFEPQISGILDRLLNNYNDSNEQVRKATAEAARSIMSQLSAHGIKLVLPVMLKALEDRTWRKKKGAVELLGAMAFCSPKQLSSCLPTIVPKLSKVINDSHTEVQEAAEEALKTIGSVIQNPEIKNHVPLILKAIIENDDQTTKGALESLIHINFVHVIDAPSLSLIVPIIHRGLKNRSSESKKRAAQILGSMSVLTDHKDLIPYIEILLPYLRDSVIDTSPEVRAISSKSLGNLIRGLGEEHFSELVPWCLKTMKSEAGSVERSGAAQALAEILASLEPKRLETLFPQILSLTADPAPHIREGYLSLFIFLPLTLYEVFQSYLKSSLPVLLEGLADETEAVRDTALRAGQAIIDQYTLTHLDLLLPPVQNSLFHDNWRLRQSAIQLMGDLLYKIVGKHEGNAELIEKSLQSTLGTERKNILLSTIYILRSDVSSIVRQRAIFVWKSNVLNTSKVLKEILVPLMAMVMEFLASPNHDKRKISGKALGEVVSKMGDKVLPEIIPILETSLRSSDANKRQGVCIGLTEILRISTKVQLLTHLSVLTSTVRIALCDDVESVSDSAMQAFDVLYKAIGSQALDEILPSLLRDIEKEDLHAMNGLKVLLSLKASTILPQLIPKLLTPPLTEFNLKALANISQVVGDALYPHLPALIPVLLDAITRAKPEEIEMVRQLACKVVLSFEGEGARLMFIELRKQFIVGSELVILECVNIIKMYCEQAPLHAFETELSNLLEMVFPLFSSSNKDILAASWTTINSIAKNIDKGDSSFIPSIHGMLSEMKSKLKKGESLPGFCLPKGPQCIITLAINSLVGGSGETRAASANILSDVLNLTPPQILSPFVITITGSLIRTMSDKFPPQVKVALLQTLNLIIIKGGPAIKSVITQLQTTLVRALKDPAKSVRTQAAIALGTLMTLSSRIDPLVGELLQKTTAFGADVITQETNLIALKEVIEKAGKNISAEEMAKVGMALTGLLSHDESIIRRIASQVLGCYAKFASESQLNHLIENQLLANHASWEQKQSACVGLRFLLLSHPVTFSKFRNTILAVVLGYLSDQKSLVRAAASEAAEALILLPDVAHDKSLMAKIFPLFENALSDESSDVRIIALKALRKFSKLYSKEISPDHLNTFVPLILSRIKERSNFSVKLAAERTIMHFLQVKTDPNVLKNYLTSIDPSSAKFLQNTLQKLNLPESDSDSDDEYKRFEDE